MHHSNNLSSQKYLRGDIYYIDPIIVPDQLDDNTVRDMSMHKRRPGLIISNNTGNLYAEYVIVAYLTTRKSPKRYPMHVPIYINQRRTSIQCENIFTVHCSRINHYCASCTPKQMYQVDNALRCALGLDQTTMISYQEYEKEIAKRKLYEKLYDDLFTEMEALKKNLSDQHIA